MVNKYDKNTKNSFEKKHAKEIKIFQKKKKQKGKKKPETDTRTFLKKKKNKKCQYHRKRN